MKFFLQIFLCRESKIPAFLFCMTRVFYTQSVKRKKNFKKLLVSMFMLNARFLNN